MLEAGYNDLDELIAEGVSIDPDDDLTTARGIKIGKLAASYIDRMTGRTFYPTEKTVKIDYKPGMKAILLPQPVIELTELRILTVPLTTDDYVLYGSNDAIQDDRDNPRIELVQGWGGINPDRSPYRNVESWRRSYPQGIEIDGTWGYCDLDDDGDPVPPMGIKMAHAKLCERLMPRAVDPMASESRTRERLVSESANGHSYSLLNLLTRSCVTGDPEIDAMIAMFKAPIRIGSA